MLAISFMTKRKKNEKGYLLYARLLATKKEIKWNINVAVMFKKAAFMNKREVFKLSIFPSNYNLPGFHQN